jgi:hypothetical protein
MSQRVDAEMAPTKAVTDAFQKAHPDGGTDAEKDALQKEVDTLSANIGKQSQRDVNSLIAIFETESRILKIPIGTKIEIAKFYDKEGNEITPVWNANIKMHSSPDGNNVYASGEWEGKTIYIFNFDN